MTVMRVEACWLPKAGNAPDEYEDAFAVQYGTGRKPFRCAVADGATETSFSKFWAELLVTAYCAGDLGVRSWFASLAPLQARWWEDVRLRDLPWYAEEKSRAGGYAALVGLTIRRAGPDALRWTALAVGDSCLLHVRDDKIIDAFPLTTAADFGRSPALVSSNVATNARVRPLVRTGIAKPGDLLALATDALACRLLLADQPPGKIADDIANLTPELFSLTVGHLRARLELRNDDVTFVRVAVE